MKKIYKKWWFWVVSGIILLFIISVATNGDGNEDASETTTTGLTTTTSARQTTTTKAAAESETKAETITEASVENILEVVSYTASVNAGSDASVTIKGKPDTEYSIKVVYSSGTSTASGLETKKSDEDGNVSWSWVVGAKTGKGTYPIKISGGDEQIEIEFEVK